MSTASLKEAKTFLHCAFSCGFSTEQHKMRCQLTAQFMPFFRLIAGILTFRDKKYRILRFRDKKYRILTFCDKTELYLTVLQQNNVVACFRCEASLSFALSGSLLLSEFAYNILARLTRPLLSSQRRCCASTLSAALLDIKHCIFLKPKLNAVNKMSCSLHNNYKVLIFSVTRRSRSDVRQWLSR